MRESAARWVVSGRPCHERGNDIRGVPVQNNRARSYRIVVCGLAWYAFLPSPDGRRVRTVMQPATAIGHENKLANRANVVVMTTSGEGGG